MHDAFNVSERPQIYALSFIDDLRCDFRPLQTSTDICVVHDDLG